MSVVAVIGAQWGDEGKGHIVDLLAERARLVVRYGGGNNAGHTVVNRRGTFKLHTVPSGIFDPATVNVIGNGVVIDPAVLVRELDDLQARGVSVDGLFISERAHVVLPYHVLQDRRDEAQRGEERIGTTGRGIGPAYADKMARIGIRMGELLDEAGLRARLTTVLALKRRLFDDAVSAEELDPATIAARYAAYGARLAHHITDSYPIVQQALEQRAPILLEGAQGALLDIDHGTYPYVTSSAPGTAGAAQGAGVAPTAIDTVLGVFKAYATRVGAGPFPTEVDGDAAAVLRQIGTPWAEVGTTTGRLRRVGWFDAVLARYAVRLNGIDTFALTKLDVLDTLAEIPVCVGYRLDGTPIGHPPMRTSELARIEPIYEVMPGWQQPTTAVRRVEDLPGAAQAYLGRISELIGARPALVSVGPAHDQIIELVPLLPVPGE